MTDKEIEKRDHALRFFPKFLTHTKGIWAGKQFDLLPWQTDLIGNLFGTLKQPADDSRQYNHVYCEIPKKNGKSELAAGVALYLLFADEESGAEIYSAAADTDQARIVFDVAAQMVRNNKSLSSNCKIIMSTKRIIHNRTGSVYRALSADAYSKHGYNIHGVIFDELHTQPNRDLWDVLTQGAGDARKQPVFFAITTAGYDRNSICWEVHEYARQVKAGIIKDPTFLPVIYGAAEDEDWTDEKVWRGCNPSIDEIIDVQKIIDACQKAKDSPALENSFRRLRLNQWTSQETRYIPMVDWDACGEAFDIKILEGQPCYAGLDMASVNDLAAFVLVFPIDDLIYTLPFFWIPREQMEKRIRKDKVNYDLWEKQGFIKSTPGNSIDEKWIIHDVVELSKKYAIQEVRFDRWGAENVKNVLTDEGFKMIDFGQGWKSMSPPTKDLLRIVLNHTLRHNSNPVLRWNADNAMAVFDPTEAVKFAKNKSSEKIDGIIGLVMALDGTMRDVGPSVYEDRGVLTF